MSVKQEYLKDENDNKFSPIGYINSVYSKGNPSFISSMAQYSELIFVGSSSDFSFKSSSSFSEILIQTPEFDKYSNFDNNLKKYIIPNDGWYTIYVRFKMVNLDGGANLGRNLHLGWCVNGNPTDSMTGRWVQQQYDRCAASYSNMITYKKGDEISFKYYCDGSTVKKVELADIFIIQENQFILSNMITQQEKMYKLKSKYLKNSNNEVISPITSTSSLYFDNKNYNQVFGNCIRLGATIHREDGAVTSTKEVLSTTSVSWKKKYSEYINNTLLTKNSDLGFPQYTVKQDGWYIIGLSIRLPDFPNREQDMLLEIIVNEITYWASAMRSTYRMGGSGSVCKYLKAGQKIKFRCWRDLEFTSVEHFNCFIKYCGDNF